MQFLNDPDVRFFLGGLVVYLVAYLKRYMDLRELMREKSAAVESAQQERSDALADAELQLECLKISTQMVMISEHNRRVTGRITPVGMQHALTAASLVKAFPGASVEKIDAAIRGTVPMTQEILRAVAESIHPSSGPAGMPAIPRRSPTGFSSDKLVAVVPDKDKT